MKKSNIELVRIEIAEAKQLWEMQVVAFYDMYLKYQDTDTSPATEKVDKIIMRLEQPFTYYYFIKINGETVCAIRFIDHKNERKKRISPMFIISEYRNQGLAQMAIKEAEKIHGSENWELETILQEAGNCHLYEKMGYRKTGKTQSINDKLTLIFYAK